MEIEKLYTIYKQCRTVFTDSRKAQNGGMFFALKGERFDGNLFAVKALEDGADYAIVDDPSLASNPKCIVVSDTLTALQQLSNYHRKQLTIPVVAVTGTNGKTTTKELIYSVLSQKYKTIATQGNLNNHIGVPLTLLSINSSHEIAIVEMGASHPKEIEQLCAIAEPDYGIITNVGTAHLEGFGSFEGVKNTKKELYTSIAKTGKGIFINIANPNLVEMAKENQIKYSYGTDDSDLYGEVAANSLHLTAKLRFPKGWLYIRTKLSGNYNLENVMAAARIGLFFDIDPLLIQKGIESYTPSNNRSQIAKKEGNVFLVDCYNANPSSMKLSLENFFVQDQPHKTIILGDMLELGSKSIEEHQKIVDQIEASTQCDSVYLIGNEFGATECPTSFIRFKTVDEFLGQINVHDWKDRFILIKGSRGIKLEKIIEG